MSTCTTCTLISSCPGEKKNSDLAKSVQLDKHCTATSVQLVQTPALPLGQTANNVTICLVETVLGVCVITSPSTLQHCGQTTHRYGGNIG